MKISSVMEIKFCHKDKKDQAKITVEKGLLPKKRSLGPNWTNVMKHKLKFYIAKVNHKLIKIYNEIAVADDLSYCHRRDGKLTRSMLICRMNTVHVNFANTRLVTGQYKVHGKENDRCHILTKGKNVYRLTWSSTLFISDTITMK